MIRKYLLMLLVAGLIWTGSAKTVSAQAYGTELYNGVGPASGAMAGVSIARPQDASSALYLNPAGASQYKGFTFMASGSWIEPSINVSHDGAVTGPFGGGPWSDRSQTEGSLLGGFTALQSLDPLGINGTAGLGLVPGSGLGTNFSRQPNSVGTTAEYLALDIVSGASFQLTDKLSAGANLIITTGILNVGLVQTTSSQHDYAVGGSFGFNYELPMSSTIGAFYRTQMNYTFDSFLATAPPGGIRDRTFTDLNVDRPPAVGIGLANRSLMDGNLLLAVDLMYIFWDDADFFKNIYEDQWAIGFGAQYSMGMFRLRGGYSYNSSPIRENVGVNLGDVVVGANVLNYLQATEGAAIMRHRLTGGIGMVDLFPGITVDLYGGGMFRESEQFGAHTSASAVSWFAGFGLTWRFGHKSADCACEACPTAQCSGPVEVVPYQ